MIRVVLGMQHPAVEAAVGEMLKADPEIVVLGDDTAAADVQILTSAAFLREIRLPEGQASSLGAILVLGAERLDLEQFWKLNTAWGVLPIDAGSDQLCAAVRAVAAGLVVGAQTLLTDPAGTEPEHGPLTEREVQVLGMLSAGLANKQVAARLGISEHTVKFHISSIYTKLNVGTRAEAVREGLRGGWIAL